MPVRVQLYVLSCILRFTATVLMDSNLRRNSNYAVITICYGFITEILTEFLTVTYGAVIRNNRNNLVINPVFLYLPSIQNTDCVCMKNVNTYHLFIFDFSTS